MLQSTEHPSQGIVGEYWLVDEEIKDGSQKKCEHLIHWTKHPCKIVISHQFFNCIDTGVANILLNPFSCLSFKYLPSSWHSLSPHKLIVISWTIQDYSQSLIFKNISFVDTKSRVVFRYYSHIYSNKYTKQIQHHHFALKILNSPSNICPHSRFSNALVFFNAHSDLYLIQIL